MRHIIDIAVLSIRMALQNPGTYVTNLVMPIALMLILGAATSTEDPTLLLDVVNEDGDSAIAADFIRELEVTIEETEALVICVYGADDIPDDCNLDSDDTFADVGVERLEEGITAAAVTIPAGFGEALTNGEATEIIYQSDEGLNAGTVARNTVQTALERLSGSITIASVGSETAEEYFNTDDSFDTLFVQARDGLENPPTSTATISTGEDIAVGSGASQSVSGTATMFVLISMLTLAAELVYERERGTLQRLFTLPVPKSSIVIGKILGRVVFGLAQFAIYIAVGVMLDVNWGDSPLGVLFTVVSFTFCATALGFLLATFVRTSDQAANIAVFASLTLAPLGGAWFPKSVMPEFMQTVGYISPIAWAMDAFNEILYNNGTLVDVLPYVLVMTVGAVAFMLLGTLRFKYE